MCNKIKATVIGKDELDGTKAFFDVFYTLKASQEENKEFLGMLRTPRSLGSSFIDMVKNETIDINKMWRQWFYQVCTQVAYFQTKSKAHYMRSEIFNIYFYRE